MLSKVFLIFNESRGLKPILLTMPAQTSKLAKHLKRFFSDLYVIDRLPFAHTKTSPTKHRALISHVETYVEESDVTG